MSNKTHKLNPFQKTVLLWNRAQPYNAAHVVKVPAALEPGRLKDSLHECLACYGLGGFRLDRARARFAYDDSGEAVPLDFLARPDDALEALRVRVEEELNTHFDSGDLFRPLRFFAAEDTAGFYLGLVYFHAIADASSIVYLLNDIVRHYESGQKPRVRAGQLYPDVRFGAGAYARRLPGWLGSLPRDVSDVRRTRRAPWDAKAPKRAGLLLERLSGFDPERSAEKSRSLGATLNDVFLAAALKSAGGLSFLRASSRRDRLAVGSIISTRRDLGLNGGREFGIFLSAFRVSCASPEKLGLTSLIGEVAHQTRRVKQGQLHMRNVWEASLARALAHFYSPARRDRFFSKYYPLAAGLTNIDPRRLWQGGAAPDYWRAVSTGPAVPLVFSVTTSPGSLNIGASFSTHVYTRRQAQEALAGFMDSIREFSKTA